MAKILVVDDHPVNRNLLTTLLGCRGHTVVEAGDGAQALALARSECPDLVITDLLMPVMDGYEFVRELRETPSLAATKVIFYTAHYLLDEARPLAAASGVRHILPKPAEPELLISMVDEVLAEPGEKASPPVVPTGELQREHLWALSAKLVDKVRELETAEAALKVSEARFRSLAESSPVGIFALDSAGQVTYSNPRLRQICGLDDLDGSGPSCWAELVHPEDRGAAVVRVVAALEGATRFRGRVRVVRPDDDVRWVDFQATPISDPDVHVNYVGTVEDVTDAVDAQRQRDELESRLRTSERLESLGQLAAGIAHDFNNMLGAILMYTQFVSSGIEAVAGSGDAHQRLAQMRVDVAAVKTAAERAADLTHQLQVFGRREILRTEVMDANEVIRDAEKLLVRTIGEHVSIETRLDPGLWPVKGDRSRLGQVVVNLVVNARDAISEIGTGVVLIATNNVELDEGAATRHPGARPGRYSRLTVTDNGAGMSRETAARAFEPFFTTKRNGTSSGLGLATVYGIVNRLGGFVSIYSERGTGTTMQVYLPAASSARIGAVAAAPQPPMTGRGEAVLLVEDDRDMRAVTSRLLAENGYSVAAADRGAAAVVLLEDPTVTIDLLLTDMVMPEMSGRDVARRAEMARPGLPVLFMSGYPDDVFTPRAMREREIEIVEKPFSHATLLRRVASALGRRSPFEGE